MSLVVEQEGDIELADLQHIQHSRLSQELRADRDTPSDAGRSSRSTYNIVKKQRRTA